MENLKKGEAQSTMFVMYSLISPCLFPHGFWLPLCCISFHTKAWISNDNKTKSGPWGADIIFFSPTNLKNLKKEMISCFLHFQCTYTMPWLRVDPQYTVWENELKYVITPQQSKEKNVSIRKFQPQLWDTLVTGKMCKIIINSKNNC